VSRTSRRERDPAGGVFDGVCPASRAASAIRLERS